jgi:hypothetical protein
MTKPGPLGEPDPQQLDLESGFLQIISEWQLSPLVLQGLARLFVGILEENQSTQLAGLLS